MEVASTFAKSSKYTELLAFCLATLLKMGFTLARSNLDRRDLGSDRRDPNSDRVRADSDRSDLNSDRRDQLDWGTRILPENIIERSLPDGAITPAWRHHKHWSVLFFWLQKLSLTQKKFFFQLQPPLQTLSQFR